MEQDYSATVEIQIPKYRELAVQGAKLAEAIENLLALEKQTRNGGDVKSTSKIAAAVVSICTECQDWKQLNQNIIFIAKRRGQEKQVIKAMVQEAMTVLDQFRPDQVNVKLELISTLRSITEGKIFVENERARLTRILAKIKEDQGEIQQAAEILQEVQIETYGSIEKREKTEFILEQVRLCLDSRDFIRASILSRKIHQKALQAGDFQDLKLKYYELMIRYHTHESNYLEICRAFQAIYDTPKIKADRTQWENYLRMIVIFVVLSPYDSEQFDLINRVYQDKNLNQLPKYRALLKYFLTMELMRWPIIQQLYEPELSQLGVFSGEYGKQLWTGLHHRVVAHNIRVIAEYYSQIHSSRLAELLDLSEQESEQFVAELVVAKSIYAKIDRPKKIITFLRPKDPSERLNDWSQNISNLLDLVEKTTHLIHRETMVHSKK